MLRSSVVRDPEEGDSPVKMSSGGSSKQHDGVFRPHLNPTSERLARQARPRENLCQVLCSAPPLSPSFPLSSCLFFSLSLQKSRRANIHGKKRSFRSRCRRRHSSGRKVGPSCERSVPRRSWMDAPSSRPPPVVSLPRRSRLPVQERMKMTVHQTNAQSTVQGGGRPLQSGLAPPAVGGEGEKKRRRSSRVPATLFLSLSC